MPPAPEKNSEIFSSSSITYECRDCWAFDSGGLKSSLKAGLAAFTEAEQQPCRCREVYSIILVIES